MPNWSENEYAKLATEIASHSVAIGRPINDLVEKTAREQALSPDEIRTLTRMTNVAAFNTHFRAKTGSDRQTEFAVGDPEEVIQRIHAKPVLPQTANVNNDKMASYEDFQLTETVTEKLAEFVEPSTVRMVSPQALARKLEQARQEFSIAKISYEQRWADKLSALQTLTRRAPGYGRVPMDELEKDAHAMFGADIAPELRALNKQYEVPAPEKIAHIADFHAVKHAGAMNILREAKEAREAYQRVTAALAHCNESLP